jgi:signal peptidase II
MPEPIPLSAGNMGLRAAAPSTHGLRWLWLALAVIVLDQVTKYAVRTALQAGDMHAYTDYFSLVLTYNSGAAFSFLANAQGWQRWFFTAIAAAAGVLLVLMLRRGGSALYCAGLALILGGAVGNLIDRLVLGKVVDYLLFHYQGWAWPAFNVADSAITLGAAALIVDSFRMRRTPSREEVA